MMLFMDFLQWIIGADTDVFLFFNGMHNTYFEHVMSVYSSKWVWVPMYASIFYVMLRNFYWKMLLFCLVALALTIIFADQIGANLIRPLVERPRPSNLANPISDLVHVVDNYRGGRYGFPSCHAANTFGLTFFIFFLFRKKWLTCFMMTWALVTCYSRVYLGVHYPGDLLVGALIGTMGAWLMYRLFLWVSQYRRPDKLIHADMPIWIGGMTTVGIFLYSTWA